MSLSLLQGKRFYCREWAFAKIAHCLENRPTSKTCGALIMGGPGCGKTALCCEIVSPTVAQGKQLSLSRRVLVYHFCQAHDTDTLSLVGFIRSLVSQISESSLVSGYNELTKKREIENALDPDNILKDPDECFRKAVLFPLVESEVPKQTCFFLVDSIDESFFHASATSNSESNKISNGVSKTIAELLANHHHMFPRWLLLVCSARKQSKSVTKMFTGFRKISLDDLRKSHVVHDVQQYILCRLDQEPRLRQHLSRETAEMLNQLHIKSNGCFLYLEKVLDGVAENFIMLREIREIPGTLNGLYLWLCQRLFVRKQFTRIQPILNAVLAARKPLTTEQLYHCVWTRNTLLTWNEFQKRFNLLSKVLIDGRNGTKILFHHSFAEWLLDVKHCTQKYLCHASEGHGMLAMRYTLKAQRLDKEEVLDFALHLSKINVSSPLQSFHLPLWLILCRAPVEDVLTNSWQPVTDPKVINLLVQAGAKATDNPQDENFKRKLKEGHQQVTVILPEDPLDALLASGSDINQTDTNQRTLLHTAAHNGDVDLVDRLILKNAALEVVDKNGQTALNLASRQGHADVVKALLKAKANPDHADNDGWTPLRSSAWAGHTEVVNALLESGAVVDLADSDQRTALRAAAWGGHEEIVLKLLEHGACVNQEDNEGRTALIAAAYMGHTEIVEHLLEHGAEINHEDADGRTALSVAALCVPASEGHAGVVSLLLECGAEVDHRDRDGMTPLLVAAFEGHSEVCELLLEGDADVDHTDNNNRTPLFAAASMGHPKVVNLLLFWGAAIDTIDSEGRTVLSIATAQGNPEVVRQLLDRGLDEMHRDNAGWTPLHYAAFEGHQEASEILIEAGARMTEVDNDGRIPLILAAQEGHTQLVGRLLKFNHSMVDIKSHDGKTGFRVSALEGHKDTVGLLIAEGADINYRDADGRSTLYLLALENRVEIAEFLLTHGADVDARDLEGRTPLHVSAWQGHYEMVDLLLAHGANVNAVDNDQRTALQSASWQGHASVVRLLLERRAYVDHTCNQGATALCIAAQEGHEEVVLVLLEYGADPNHADQFGRNPLRVATKGNHNSVIRILEEFASQAAEFGRSVHCHGSTSTTSLTSASTAETKPCSAILCQPGVTISGQNEVILLESPTSTAGGNRRSFVSNHSSSRSSSNLTNSTNKSTQQLPQTVIENRVSHDSGNLNQMVYQQTAPTQPNYQPSVPQNMTFTQQLQQCTRNRNRASRVLSPLSEPQNSPVPSPPQSPLSEVLSQRLSPVSLSPQGNSGNSPHHVHVPIVINPPAAPNQSSTPIRSSQPIDTAIPRPPEPKFRRNGIVTNPNYKGGYVKSKDPNQSHHGSIGGGPTVTSSNKNQSGKNKQNSSHVMPIYEESIKIPKKKETPL